MGLHYSNRRLFLSDMSAKTIIIWVVVVIIVIAGGWFIYSKMSSPSTPASATDTSASSTPQVQAQDITVGTGTEATPGSMVSEVRAVSELRTVSELRIYNAVLAE